MLKRINSDSTNPNSAAAALIAFKPRQVVLAELRAKATLTMTKKNKQQSRTLNQEQKASLIHSVIRYLDKNGFSKTLKRFLSEAQIQNEDWKASSLDLEDLYCKYLETCDHAETIANTCKKEELQMDDTVKADANNIWAASDEFSKKKKKKRSGECDSNVAVDHCEATAKELHDSFKNSENVDYGSKAKTKGKKKSKEKSDSPDQNEQVQSLAAKKNVEVTVSGDVDDLTKKNKDKKKKRRASISEASVNNVDQEKVESLTGVAEEQSKILASAECDLKKEKKSSKKRKRLDSEENEYQPVDNKANEELKRRKTESKKKEYLVDDGVKGSKQENDQIGTNDLEKNGKDKKNKDQLNEHANENFEKNGDNSSSQKSTRKQRNGSAEPKTINAFQRVKIGEVEFADEKLQDNSYWAKDGAEIGYGAKAQEVLGQVRGRDFRHEKTKKKRGSYRGGLIDLQSHSVKFNYSDEY